MRAFASDNYAPAHPAVLAALADVNIGHTPAYGNDPWTAQAKDLIRRHVGVPDAEVHLVFNGTGANVVGLSTLLERWEAIICADSAHINVDEGGAPERLLGAKLIDLQTPDGKLRPDQVAAAVIRKGDVHYAQPRIVSITQSTEWGTVYTPAEVRALADVAHEHGLYLHMDGARISNAAAALNLPISEFTAAAGVDVLSFGGTKNGLIGAEAVVIMQPTTRLGHLAKQSMQLSSKMRYASAQFIAMFGSDLWLDNARHANAMAARLANGIRGIAGVEIVQPQEVNSVFVRLPQGAIKPLQDEFHFYGWIESERIVRLMCSWDTTAEDVDAFVAGIKKAVG